MVVIAGPALDPHCGGQGGDLQPGEGGGAVQVGDLDLRCALYALVGDVQAHIGKLPHMVPDGLGQLGVLIPDRLVRPRVGKPHIPKGTDGEVPLPARQLLGGVNIHLDTEGQAVVARLRVLHLQHLPPPGPGRVLPLRLDLGVQVEIAAVIPQGRRIPQSRPLRGGHLHPHIAVGVVPHTVGEGNRPAVPTFAAVQPVDAILQSALILGGPGLKIA